MIYFPIPPGECKCSRCGLVQSIRTFCVCCGTALVLGVSPAHGHLYSGVIGSDHEHPEQPTSQAPLNTGKIGLISVTSSASTSTVASLSTTGPTSRG